jgi:hypothetical protein
VSRLVFLVAALLTALSVGCITINVGTNIPASQPVIVLSPTPTVPLDAFEHYGGLFQADLPTCEDRVYGCRYFNVSESEDSSGLNCRSTGMYVSFPMTWVHCDGTINPLPVSYDCYMVHASGQSQSQAFCRDMNGRRWDRDV